MIDIKQFPLGPLQTNCYFVGCEQTKKCAIIDPSDDGQQIAQYIEQGGWELTHILLTHSHFDHIGGLADLKAAIDAPIYAHADSLEMLKHGPASAERFGLSIPEPPEPEMMMVEGDVIEVGKVIKLSVLFTPGHAPGHVSLYAAEHGVVFSGDALFQGSIGRTDLPGGDFTVLMDSIAEKLMTLPDETHVLSGHGNATTIGNERVHNPFLQ